MFAGYAFADSPFAGVGQANIAIEVTGVSAQVIFGDPVKTGISVSPDPVVGTVSIGTAIAQANADVLVTGVDATTSLDSVTVYLQKQVAVTGVQAANDVGTVEVDAKANVELTGLNATAYLGTADSAIFVDVYPTGVNATGYLGTSSESGDSNFIVTGTFVLNSSLGEVSLVTNNAVSVTGVNATASLGSVTANGKANAEPAGLSATVSLGTVTVSAIANITINTSGLVMTCRTSTPLVWGIIDTTQNPNWTPIAA